MSLVLRLDVPALERLIGGDSEAEIQLRQGVVEEFTRRHLVAVLKDASFAKFLRAEADVLATGLQALVQAHIGEIKKVPGTWRDTVTVHLTDEVRAALAEEADKRVSEAIRKAVDDAWAIREKRIVGDISKAIFEKTERLTESLVRDLVRERLSKIASGINADGKAQQ